MGRRDVPQAAATHDGVLSASSADGSHWQVIFAPPKPERYELRATLLASELSSVVKAGENRNRRLNHDFVVMALVEKPLLPDGDVFKGECTLVPERAKGRRAVAMWVTRAGQLESLQAVGGWISSVASPPDQK
jgi:hypothetical protein